MKIQIAIHIGSEPINDTDPIASASTEMILEVNSTNPAQTVADLLVAAEQAVSQAFVTSGASEPIKVVK